MRLLNMDQRPEKEEVRYSNHKKNLKCDCWLWRSRGSHWRTVGSLSALKAALSWQPARKLKPQFCNNNNPFNHLNELRSTSSPKPPGRKAVPSMPWWQRHDTLSRPSAVLGLASTELGAPRSNYRLSSWLPLWSWKNSLASLSLSLLMVLVRIIWDAYITIGMVPGPQQELSERSLH